MSGSDPPAARYWVRLIDQAEELLTRTGTHEQQSFLEMLGGALQEDSPVWAVATVRSEFLSTAPDRAGFAEVVDDPLLIESLSRNRLAEVITRPAQRAGLEFGPGLVERMVEDTAGGDALPLLGYTLHQLYQRTGPEGRVTEAEYDALGGVIGAVRHRADRLTEELDRRGLGTLVLPTLTRLATVTGEEQPTRRRVHRSAFRAEEQAVVDTFVDASLLVSSRDPADPAAEAVVEVAHEALLRQWPPLRDAIEADRSLLRLRSELERLAADWGHGRRDDSYLLRGGRLATIDHWASEHPGELGTLEREFVEGSRRLATRELEATRRSNRRLRGLAAGLALLLVAALVAGGLAVVANEKAQDQTRLALSRQLAAQAMSLLDSRPETALLLSVEGLQTAVTNEAVAALQAGLSRPHHVATLFLGHTDTVRTVAFNPDGRALASASADRTVRLWNPATGQPLGTPLTGHEEAVNAVAFSPDGRALASASADRTVRLWNPATGQPLGTPTPRQEDEVWKVAFSPNGKILASAGTDRTVRLWNVATGQPIGAPLRGHETTVSSVAFRPDGKMLASASFDHTVRVWSMAVESWPSEACRTANRNFSQSEWDEFVGRATPYVRTCPQYPSGIGAPPTAPERGLPRLELLTE